MTTIENRWMLCRRGVDLRCHNASEKKKEKVMGPNEHKDDD